MANNNIWLGQAINLATAECLHKGEEDNVKALLTAVIKHYQRIEMIQNVSIKKLAEMLGKNDVLDELQILNERLK